MIALDGQVHVVVGAGQGIGREAAHVYAAAGARVVHEPRRGYGSAYLAGFAAARGRFRTVVPDFRGQGQTPGDGSPVISMDQCADDVERLLDDLQLDRVHVVAQSMGGDVAIRLAARRPAGVALLVSRR